MEANPPPLVDPSLPVVDPSIPLVDPMKWYGGVTPLAQFTYHTPTEEDVFGLYCQSGNDVTKFGMGGVNHCRPHCRLAKFRGLMYGVKYSDVIGLKKPIAWKL
jgi:hypothetical protein